MRLNLSQRVVLVIGWGLALSVGSRYLIHVLASPHAAGWFNYSANRAVSFEGSTPGLDLWVSLAALALWVAGALWLLRSPHSPSGSPADE